MRPKYGEFPVFADGKWTGEWSEQVVRVSPTLDSLRQPARYWIRNVERDLKPRTLEQVYAENRAGRIVMSPAKIARMAKPGSGEWGKLLQDYGNTMRKLHGKKWRPHPASVDPEHPTNRWRERMPKHELVEEWEA